MVDDSCYFCCKHLLWEEQLPRELRRMEKADQVLAFEWGLCVLNREGVSRLRRTKGILRCRTLLLPEDCRLFVQTEQVVSYGLSGKNSLTLSSMGERLMLCVQRELTHLSGAVVERQELALPENWSRYPAEGVLAAMGAKLLL
ncbi:MAG: hypothetical protein GXW99_01050 [Clostridiales bacterium]|nr:hypothetical protein [Clostridiales bacterium]